MEGYGILRRGNGIYRGMSVSLDLLAPILPVRKTQPIFLSRNLDPVLGSVCSTESAILHFFIVTLRLHFPIPFGTTHCFVLG